MLPGEGFGRRAGRRQRVRQPGDLRGAQLLEQCAGEHVRAGDDAGVAPRDLCGVHLCRAAHVAAQHGQLGEAALGLLERGAAGGTEVGRRVGEPGACLLQRAVRLRDRVLQRAAVTEAPFGDEHRRPVALHAQRVRGGRDAGADLEQLVRRVQLGGRVRLVRDPEHAQDQREQRGNEPDRHELPHQWPVARAQSVRPGGSGLGAGHAHVPRLLFDSAAADDVRPHSDTSDRRFANAASRGVLCPRWMTGRGATDTDTAGPRWAGAAKEGACAGSVGVIGGTV